MHRLSGQDAGFLALETPTQPLHGFTVLIIRPSVGEDGATRQVTLADLRAHVRALLPDVTFLRWRVLPVPFGLNHPIAVEDPEFDLDHHLGEVTLDAPGGPAEFDRFCAEQASQHVDRRRPLWRATLVHGLSEGRQALVWVGHHALGDGAGGNDLYDRLFSPLDEEAAPPSVPPGEHIPSQWRLAFDGIVDYGRKLRTFPAFVGRFRRGLAAAQRFREASPVSVPQGRRDTPPSLINNGFTIERRFTRVSFPLEDFATVRRAAPVTVNDVLLTVASEGFRRYLLARDALPDRPLTCGVLVALDNPGTLAELGNHFAGLTTSLCTDVPDLWDRMLAIHQVTDASKEALRAFDPTLIGEGLEIVPPWVATRFLHWDQRRRLRDPDRIGQNVVVSNVKGSKEPWVLGPGTIEDVYCGGSPNRGVGVNVTAWSYLGRLGIGVLAFADSMDSPVEFAGHMTAALSELVEIARTGAPARPSLDSDRR